MCWPWNLKLYKTTGLAPKKLGNSTLTEDDNETTGLALRGWRSPAPVSMPAPTPA